MGYRKYTLIALSILIIILLYNAFVWQFYTKQWFTSSSIHVGDLSRLGYIPDAAHPRKTLVDLPIIHKETTNFNFGEEAEIVVIGDSFANSVSGGKNPSFTDYIASKYAKTVLNIGELPSTSNYIETIALLANSGFLKDIGTKIVIIESTQRQLARRFAVPINFDKNESLEHIIKIYGINQKFLDYNNSHIPIPNIQNNSDDNTAAQHNKITFINNGNFKFAVNKIIYLFSDSSPLTNVVIKDLNQSLFNTHMDKKLLNFRRDIYMKDIQDINNVQKINANLNQLSRILKEQNIVLAFMPIASKYIIYEPYIINNRLPKDNFFSILNNQPREYTLIDTKKILDRAMPIKDLYYGDDTHWSYIASDIVISSHEFKELFSTKE